MEMTFEVIWGAIVLIGMVITAATSILTLREKATAAREPHHAHMAQVDDHERRLNRDHTDIEELQVLVDELKRMVNNLDALNVIQTNALRALLKHEIDGNDIHALQTELTFMERYLHPDYENYQQWKEHDHERI